jgi:dihydrofolate synthase/folylpolyglutamate synthase
VVTSISYDHTAILGHTLGAIASEKAGILRVGRPALLALQRPAAMRALRHVCRELNARCCVISPLDRDLPLAGAHQKQNAGLAVAAARVMSPAVGDAEVEVGLSRVYWPGRFEIVDNLVLDGAHNGASAEALADTLERYAAGKPISLVIGINRDKDARAVLRPLIRIGTAVWATQTRGNPRALDAAALASLCRRLGAKNVTGQADLASALEAAQRTAGLVCVTGSLMLVGQARDTLGLPPPEQLW